MWNDRSNAPHRLAEARTQFAAMSIDLPRNIIEALHKHDKIREAIPAAPGATAIRDAILAGASASQINALLLADLGHQRLRSEWTQAAVLAAQAALDALADDSGAVFDQLQAYAQQRIERIEHVANIADGLSLDVLVAKGRDADARAVVGLDSAAAELTRAYRVRDQFLARGGISAMRAARAVIDCSRWQHPDRVASGAHGHRQPSEGQRYVAGVRVGAGLWFPNAAQENSHAQPLIAQTRRELAEHEAAIRNAGGISAFA